MDNRISIPLVAAFCIGCLLICTLISGCTQTSPAPSATPVPTQAPVKTTAPTTVAVNTSQTNVGLANPASVNCEKVGGKTKILKNPDGSEYGVCTFANGTTCEEWALLRGECNASKAAGPGTAGKQNATTADGQQPAKPAGAPGDAKAQNGTAPQGQPPVKPAGDAKAQNGSAPQGQPPVKST